MKAVPIAAWTGFIVVLVGFLIHSPVVIYGGVAAALLLLFALPRR